MALLDDVFRDLRYAARTVTCTPGFLVCVLSLGLAIGAITALYNTADWLTNRSSRGVYAPDRVVALGLSDREHPQEPSWGF